MANLPDLVTATAKSLKRKRTVTDEVCRAFIRRFQEALARDGEVHIFGFGRFVVRTMPPRGLTDLRTGERVVAEGRDRIWFQPYRRTVKAVRKPRARNTAR